MIKQVRLGMTGLKAMMLRRTAATRLAAAVALLLLAGSCCNEDNILDNEVEREIAFSAYTGKVTKAEITDGNAMATEGGFIVWGYKATSTSADKWIYGNHTSEIITIFDSVNVYTSKTGDGTYQEGEKTVWTYAGNRKYWDRGARYSFYAVAPANPTNGKYAITGDNYSKRRIKITGVKSGLAANSDDFMISRSGKDSLDLSGSDCAANSNYDFSFYHTMAKLVFKVKRSSADMNKLTINNLVISGFNPNDGTFEQALTSTPSSGHSGWTIATNSNEGSYTLVGTGASQSTVEITTASTSELVDQYIVVPQTVAVNKLKFSIRYDVTYSDDTVDEYEVTDSLRTEQVWGTDSQITYTLTIGPTTSAQDMIKFDVSSISGWTTTDNGLNYER